MTAATKITQNTLVPVSLIISLGFLAFQVGNSYSKIQINEQQIASVRTESKETLKTLKSIENRLVKIETLLAK